MTGPAGCRLIGRWRIVESDLWSRDHPDPVELASSRLGPAAAARSPGALEAGLDLEYSRSRVSFSCLGFDEREEASGSGSAALLDDGTLAIEIACHLGDQACLKGRQTSSAAC